MNKELKKIADICNVPALPAGLHCGSIRYVHIVYLSSGKRGRIFFKDDNGKVFCDRPVNMARECVTNDIERKAFAQLAGITLKEIKAVMRAAKIEERERVLSSELHRLKRSATRAGFRLVKIKSKTPFVAESKT